MMWLSLEPSDAISDWLVDYAQHSCILVSSNNARQANKKGSYTSGDRSTGSIRSVVGSPIVLLAELLGCKLEES